MKNIRHFLILILLFYFMLQIFYYTKEVNEAILLSFSIFKNNVFPNLFPFLILSGLLINYGFVDICSKVFKKIMKKLFKVSGNASFIFFMSMLSGFPSNAKYTKELLQNGYINELEATKILMFTHFSNPLFILGMISSFLNKKLAILILICHYLGNIIIGLIFRNIKIDVNNNKSCTSTSISFGQCLSNTIKNSIDTLLLIFGTITTFFIITTIIKVNFNFSPFIQTLISGILEMTQGLKLTSILDISIKYKAILMTMFLSFGGLSVHMQVLSIISDTKIKYFPFFFSRIMHAIISSLLVYFLI